MTIPPPPPPMGPPSMQMEPPPDNYLVWAILATVLCCWPLGIPAIVFSTQVNTKWAAGDRVGARESARKAKNFAIWSAIGAAAAVLLYVIIWVVILGAAASSS